MKNVLNSIAAALWAILIVLCILTYQLTTQPPENTDLTTKMPVEKVLPIIGRTTIPFEGIGAAIGFLAKDGDQYIIIPYDRGSMADNNNWEPKYVTRIEFTDGTIRYQPLLVDKF